MVRVSIARKTLSTDSRHLLDEYSEKLQRSSREISIVTKVHQSVLGFL
jgi:hypothetical protein